MPQVDGSTARSGSTPDRPRGTTAVPSGPRPRDAVRRAPGRGRRDLRWLPAALAIWLLSFLAVPVAVLAHDALTGEPTRVQEAADTSVDDSPPVDPAPQQGGAVQQVLITPRTTEDDVPTAASATPAPSDTDPTGPAPTPASPSTEAPVVSSSPTTSQSQPSAQPTSTSSSPSSSATAVPSSAPSAVTEPAAGTGCADCAVDGSGTTSAG